MVPTVCTLKKNASAKDPCRALATPPVTRNTQAKTTFTASTSAAMAASVTHQGERRSVWYRSPNRSCGALTTSMPLSGSGCCLAIAPAWRARLLDVELLLDVVLQVARLAADVAAPPVGVALGLLRAAVGMGLVLGVVHRVLDLVLRVLLLVALVGQRGQSERKGQCSDDSSSHGGLLVLERLLARRLVRNRRHV